MREKPLPNRILCDFDGTLSRTKFNSSTGHYDPGEVFEAVAEAVTDQHFLGREIVIFTARPEEEWKEVAHWLDRQAIPFKRITNIKEPALLYIDDRSMRPEEFVIWNRVERGRK